MKKNRIFGLTAILLAAAMIAVAVFASAGTTITDEEINTILNTSTDTSKITSPYLDAVNKVRNSVVGVNNYQTMTGYYGYGRGGQQQSQEALAGTGSGVCVTSYGHVLTNYHVVEDATRLTVTDYDGNELEATVASSDADLDIAVLYVPGLTVSPVELGDSDALQVGEWAIVIGNPLGEDLARSVTVGVVSALDRAVTDTTKDRYGRNSSVTNSMIQVDAAISSGNSGGGMFNILGQLQGIPARVYANNSFSSMFSSTTVENIGLCIPINTAKPLIEEVLRSFSGETAAAKNNSSDNQSSSIVPTASKPRIGVSVSTLSSSANGALPNGAYVAKVEENSPAAAAGLQIGDIVVEIDGEVIQSSTGMVSKLADYQAGDILPFKVYRVENITTATTVDELGEGQYIDLNIELKVLDDVNM